MKLPHNARALAIAVLASILVAGCGSGASEEQLAQQVEIAKQAADRAVAAQQAAEVAAGKASSSSSSSSSSAVAGSGFRDSGGETNDAGPDTFGAPTVQTTPDQAPVNAEEPAAPAN